MIRRSGDLVIGKAKAHHGDNHPKQAKTGLVGDPGTEARRNANGFLRVLRASVVI